MANICLTLYTNGFFGSVLKSPTQMGSFSINNSVTNISRLGTFNEADFLGFWRNWFFIGPLHYLSSRSAFGFEFADIFVIEKRLPDSTIRGVGDCLIVKKNIIGKIIYVKSKLAAHCWITEVHLHRIPNIWQYSQPLSPFSGENTFLYYFCLWNMNKTVTSPSFGNYLQKLNLHKKNGRKNKRNHSQRKKSK